MKFRNSVLVLLIVLSPLFAIETTLQIRNNSIFERDGSIQIGPAPSLEYRFLTNSSPSTITLDESGNNNTGTVVNATWVDDAVNPYYEFDGDDINYEANSFSTPWNGSSNWTIAVTVYPDLWPDNDEVFSHWDFATDDRSLLLRSRSSGAMRIRWSYDGINTEEMNRGSWPTGTWWTVTLVQNDDTMLIYQDSDLASSWAVTGPIYANTNNAFIGRSSTGGNAFNGRISNVQTWGRSLSSNEVANYVRKIKH